MGRPPAPVEDPGLAGGEWVTRNGIRVWMPSRCGTRRGYYDHYNAGEPACRPCLDALATYERERQARIRGGPKRLHPCGTPAAYRRHLRHGEPPCDDCLDAVRRRYHQNKAAGRAGPNRPSRRQKQESR